MWILIPLILINSVANNKTFVLEYRVDIAGLPINVIDFLIFLGVLAALFPRNPRNSIWADRAHPLMTWILVSFGFVGLVGFVMGTVQDIPLRWVATPMRNALTLPAAVLIGYRFLATPRSSIRLSYLVAIGSILSATVILLFVRDTTEVVESGMASFDKLRSTAVGGDAGIAALGLVLFGMVAGHRFFPRLISLLIIAICTSGIFLLPHRSGWVLAGATLFYTVFMLQQGHLPRKLIYGVFGTVLLGAVLLGSVTVVSRATGKDFGGYITKRLVSLLPGDEGGSQAKAWASRLPGANRELELWTNNFFLGNGFGIQELDKQSTGIESYYHTPWISVMATSGIVGLVAYALVIIGLIVVSRRMVRDNFDRGTLMVGVLGSIHGMSSFLVGFMSLNWNSQRPALALGLMCGMVLRTRAMQAKQAQLAREQEGLAERYEADQYGMGELPPLSPHVGGW